MTSLQSQPTPTPLSSAIDAAQAAHIAARSTEAQRLADQAAAAINTFAVRLGPFTAADWEALAVRCTHLHYLSATLEFDWAGTVHQAQYIYPTGNSPATYYLEPAGPPRVGRGAERSRTIAYDQATLAAYLASVKPATPAEATRAA